MFLFFESDMFKSHSRKNRTQTKSLKNKFKYGSQDELDYEDYFRHFKRSRLHRILVARQSQGALILRTFALELHTSGPDVNTKTAKQSHRALAGLLARHPTCL